MDGAPPATSQEENVAGRLAKILFKGGLDRKGRNACR